MVWKSADLYHGIVVYFLIYVRNRNSPSVLRNFALLLKLSKSVCIVTYFEVFVKHFFQVSTKISEYRHQAARTGCPQSLSDPQSAHFPKNRKDTTRSKSVL